MATYPKKLKTLEIHLMLDSEVVTVADTATDPKASNALAQFEDYKDMVWEDNGTVVVPYHAVQYIKVTAEDADVSKADPYGCE